MSQRRASHGNPLRSGSVPRAGRRRTWQRQRVKERQRSRSERQGAGQEAGTPQWSRSRPGPHPGGPEGPAGSGLPWSPTGWAGVGRAGPRTPGHQTAGRKWAGTPGPRGRACAGRRDRLTAGHSACRPPGRTGPFSPAQTCLCTDCAAGSPEPPPPLHPTAENASLCPRTCSRRSPRGPPQPLGQRQTRRIGWTSIGFSARTAGGQGRAIHGEGPRPTPGSLLGAAGQAPWTAGARTKAPGEGALAPAHGGLRDSALGRGTSWDKPREPRGAPPISWGCRGGGGTSCQTAGVGQGGAQSHIRGPKWKGAAPVGGGETAPQCSSVRGTQEDASQWQQFRVEVPDLSGLQRGQVCHPVNPRASGPTVETPQRAMQTPLLVLEM